MTWLVLAVDTSNGAIDTVKSADYLAHSITSDMNKKIPEWQVHNIYIMYLTFRNL